MTPLEGPATVLFLCTNNFYRSRFAEILFNRLAGRLGLAWRAESAGLALQPEVNGDPFLAVQVRHRLAALGISVEGHLRLPRSVCQGDLERAGLVIALKEAEHRPRLESRFPAWSGPVEYWHVHDLDCATAEQGLAAIERHVLALASRLLCG
jgi:protein-tyrosine phosphatase